MACCLSAPSHYLTLCWLFICNIQWLLSEANFFWQDCNLTWELFIYHIISFIFPRGKWTVLMKLLWYWKFIMRHHISSWWPVASFIKGVNQLLAEWPLKTNGCLANRGLTSLVKKATGVKVTKAPAAIMMVYLWRRQIARCATTLLVPKMWIFQN